MKKETILTPTIIAALLATVSPADADTYTYLPHNDVKRLVMGSTPVKHGKKTVRKYKVDVSDGRKTKRYIAGYIMEGSHKYSVTCEANVTRGKRARKIDCNAVNFFRGYKNFKRYKEVDGWWNGYVPNSDPVIIDVHKIPFWRTVSKKPRRTLPPTKTERRKMDYEGKRYLQRVNKMKMAKRGIRRIYSR